MRRGSKAVECGSCDSTGTVFEDDDRGWEFDVTFIYDGDQSFEGNLCPSCVKEFGL